MAEDLYSTDNIDDAIDNDSKVKIFQFLLNTPKITDAVVIKVFKLLFKGHESESFLDWLLEVEETELSELIKPCGLQMITAKNMKKCAR